MVPQRLYSSSSPFSSFSRIFVDRELVPGQSIFDHDVEVSDELAHAGGDCDLERFSGGGEPLVKGLHDRVELGGGVGGHVEDVAQVDASAADVPGAYAWTGVVIVRSDAEERG